MRRRIWKAFCAILATALISACSTSQGPAPARLEVPAVAPISAGASQTMRSILVEIRAGAPKLCLSPAKQVDLAEFVIALTKDRRKLADLRRRALDDGR